MNENQNNSPIEENKNIEEQETFTEREKKKRIKKRVWSDQRYHRQFFDGSGLPTRKKVAC